MSRHLETPFVHERVCKTDPPLAGRRSLHPHPLRRSFVALLITRHFTSLILTGRFCGSTKPAAVKATSGSMTIVFQTDEFDAYRGLILQLNGAPK